MIRPSKHDRPEGWLQRVFLEAIARVRLWPAWKRRAMERKTYRNNFDELLAARPGNDGYSWLGATLEPPEKLGPYPLECCGKIPSECECLNLPLPPAEAFVDAVTPIRVSLEMVEDAKFDLVGLIHYAMRRDLQHESALAFFSGI